MIQISKQVAEAVKLVTTCNSHTEIVTGHLEEEWTGVFTPLNSLTLDELIHAIYIGYEVKKSPEEKVKELYGSYHVGAMSGERYHEGAQDAIEEMIKIIGMKVEGINDDN